MRTIGFSQSTQLCRTGHQIRNTKGSVETKLHTSWLIAILLTCTHRAERAAETHRLPRIAFWSVTRWIGSRATAGAVCPWNTTVITFHRRTTSRRPLNADCLICRLLIYTSAGPMILLPYATKLRFHARNRQRFFTLSRQADRTDSHSKHQHY